MKQEYKRIFDSGYEFEKSQLKREVGQHMYNQYLNEWEIDRFMKQAQEKMGEENFSKYGELFCKLLEIAYEQEDRFVKELQKIYRR